jgi:cell division protein FtsL
LRVLSIAKKAFLSSLVIPVLVSAIKLIVFTFQTLLLTKKKREGFLDWEASLLPLSYPR